MLEGKVDDARRNMALMRQHDPQVTPALLEIRLRRWFGMIEQCDQLCAWAKQHWEPESVAS